ncbi:hypothetical protein N7495_005777 [Penicillium taxi]|uniref:uncharacterized protein n=1 Tax=Penicillium taxi TaxID=168475 RepID=UPI002544E2B8|nr:uncharacterized protein N7495_005777 [Penicillium taxi]KAJ5894086.1 hypothetical protein N7495_005777 [Penicillium taxi]
MPHTITLHPRVVLRNVADALNCRHEELSVTLPVHSTLVSALRAAESAITDIDEDIAIMPRGIRGPKLRELAISIQSWGKSSTEQRSDGREIRSSMTLPDVNIPFERREEIREKIRAMAIKARDEEFREPYVTLRAETMDSYIPIIRANITLRAIESGEDDLIESWVSKEMIFDTGAHRTIISEEVLSPIFLEYLKDPIHEEYRRDQTEAGNGMTVQLDAEIQFSNCILPISTIVQIVPKSKIPNRFVGILLGQVGAIDRLGLSMKPRQILEAKGEQVPANVWGDIMIDEYADLFGDLHVL